MAEIKKTPETQSKKKQFVIFGLCSFLALALSGVVLVVGHKLKGENREIIFNIVVYHIHHLN